VNGVTWVLVALTLVIGAVDWVAVFVERKPIEYVAKPTTMLPLIAAALVLDPAEPSMRPWFVVALVCSLAGDVFLMIPKPEQFFVPGLASFLVGHLAYIVGMAQAPVSGARIVVGVVVTFVALLSVGPTIVKGAAERDRRLGVPVTAYILTISVMVTFAIGGGTVAGIVGALLFFLSDAFIGWSRFVQDFRHSHVAIMVTYHLAQVGLVLSLAATHT